MDDLQTPLSKPKRMSRGVTQALIEQIGEEARAEQQAKGKVPPTIPELMAHNSNSWKAIRDKAAERYQKLFHAPMATE